MFSRSLALASAMALSFAASASADRIPAGSTLSLFGINTYTPTSVTFNGPAGIGGSSGAFTALSLCDACVTVHDFNDSSTNFVVYDDSQTDLTLDSVSFDYNQALGALTVTGDGTATFIGFDPTPGSFTLTTQGPTETNVTFSSTTTTNDVPEPATLALLGVALIGFGMVYRNKPRRTSGPTAWVDFPARNA